MSYTSHPSPLQDGNATVSYLRNLYGMTTEQATDLIKRADDSPSGMASMNRGDYATVWVTFMTTQSRDGVRRYITEREIR